MPYAGAVRHALAGNDSFFPALWRAAARSHKNTTLTAAKAAPPASTAAVPHWEMHQPHKADAAIVPALADVRKMPLANSFASGAVCVKIYCCVLALTPPKKPQTTMRTAMTAAAVPHSQMTAYKPRRIHGKACTVSVSFQRINRPDIKLPMLLDKP